MNYRLVLSNLKFVVLQFLVTIDIDVSCHVNIRVFQIWPKGKRCTLTYQCSISSEKTKVTQFVSLCRIMACLVRTSEMASYKKNTIEGKHKSAPFPSFTLPYPFQIELDSRAWNVLFIYLTLFLFFLVLSSFMCISINKWER